MININILALTFYIFIKFLSLEIFFGGVLKIQYTKLLAKNEFYFNVVCLSSKSYLSNFMMIYVS